MLAQKGLDFLGMLNIYTKIYEIDARFDLL